MLNSQNIHLFLSVALMVFRKLQFCYLYLLYYSPLQQCQIKSLCDISQKCVLCYVSDVSPCYQQQQFMQQQAALMAAASQGTYINPMAALATQMPHAAAPLANGITSPVVPPTSGEHPPPCPGGLVGNVGGCSLVLSMSSDS